MSTAAPSVTSVFGQVAALLLALEDIGKELVNCPFTGLTMQAAVKAVTAQVRVAVAPWSKAEGAAEESIDDGMMALATIDDGVNLLDESFAGGVNASDGVGVTAIGYAIERLANDAGLAFQTAAQGLGMTGSDVFE